MTDSKEYKKNLLNPQVRLEDFNRIENTNNTGYTKFYYINKTLYDIKDYSIFDDFLYVMKYLVSENYIVIEIEENKNFDIFRFFLLKEDNTDKQRADLESEYKSLVQLSKQKEYIPNITNCRYGYYKTDADYLDFKIQIKHTEFQKYVKFFSQKITVKPELGVFINRGFINSQEYGLKISHKKTNVAIGVTIIVSLISLFSSISLNKSTTDFWRENELVKNKNYSEIVDILKDIKSLNEKQLEIIANIYIKSEDKHISEIKSEIEELHCIQLQLVENLKNQ